MNTIKRVKCTVSIFLLKSSIKHKNSIENFYLPHNKYKIASDAWCCLLVSNGYFFLSKEFNSLYNQFIISQMIKETSKLCYKISFKN